jgi:hypothetical protein
MQREHGCGGSFHGFFSRQRENLRRPCRVSSFERDRAGKIRMGTRRRRVRYYAVQRSRRWGRVSFIAVACTAAG